MSEDYNSKTVVELKKILKKRELPVSGNKKDLIDRLKNDDGVESSSSSEEKPKKTTASGRPKRKATQKSPFQRDDSTSDSESDDPPPKKKVTKKRAKPAKTSDESSDEEPPTKKRKVEGSGKGRIKLDDDFPGKSGAAVHEEYGVMMNQTNIGANNNKFYKIQLVVQGGKYYLYTKWGRVGEKGKGQKKGPFNENTAIANFKKQFHTKSGNNWDQRSKFVEKKGKYKIIDIDYEDDDLEEVNQILEKLSGSDARPVRKVKPCTLEGPKKDFIQLIFDNDMFKTQMEHFQLDVKKMPLGKLSKNQIDRGFEILEDIEEALTEGGNLEALCSSFYTQIPHSFGRKTPPVLRDAEDVQRKKDMLNVLLDIAHAQNLIKEKDDHKLTVTEVDHPLDAHYKALKCDVTPVAQDTDDYQKIADYLENTMGKNKLELIDLLEIRRHGEEERFSAYDHITHRKLLWHGTNVAVVAAILSSGMRIMPHAGGRVGKGLYFASENSKSANYVQCAGDIGIMVLAEVALGDQHIITRDDPSLKKAPTGFDSIIAKGWTEPDPALDSTLVIDGKEVIIPQGKPIEVPEYKKSNFTQSEYLIYNEGQARIRYLCKLRFKNRGSMW
jgi:poly [ADP-ribose] polymerase